MVQSIFRNQGLLQALGFTWAFNNGHLEVARLPRERGAEEDLSKLAVCRIPLSRCMVGPSSPWTRCSLNRSCYSHSGPVNGLA